MVGGYKRDQRSEAEGTHLEECQSSPGVQAHFPGTRRRTIRFYMVRWMILYLSVPLLVVLVPLTL